MRNFWRAPAWAALLCSLAHCREPVPPRNDSAAAAAPGPSLRIALEPPVLAAALGVPPESLRAAGEERYRRSSYDSAQAIWRVELARAQAANDPAAEARTRMWLGLAAWRLGDYETARREGELSLEQKRRIGLDAELSRSFNALGLLAWQQGRLRAALQHFDSAIVSARRNTDVAGAARAASNVPLVLVELGDFDGARRGFDVALASAREIEDERMQGNLLANLAMLDIRLGKADSALSKLKDARRHYASIGYPAGEANALGQLATAWSELGDLQRAMAAADSGLAIARSKGLQQEVAAALEVVADLHFQAGNPRLALSRLIEADSIDAALGLAIEHGRNLRRVSSILSELGETPAAVARAREALAAHGAVGARADITYDRLQLAQALALSGDARGAAAIADTAWNEARTIGGAAILREASVARARLALDARDPNWALDAIDRLERSQVQPDWRLDDLRAEALVALGRLDDARRAAEKATAALLREHHSRGGGPPRSAYLGSRTAAFSRLVAIHLALRDTAAAFQVAASVPGRSLSDRSESAADPSPELARRAEREGLLRRIQALERASSDLEGETGHDEERTSLAKALTAARSAYEDQMARDATTPGSGSVGAPVATARSVGAQLAPDEAVLLFLSGPQRLDVFVVRPGRVMHRKVPVSSSGLAQRVRLVRQVLETDAGASDTAALSSMHDLLLRPVLDSRILDGVARITIVPHGALGALPFAALRNRATGRHLIEGFVLRHAPSVSALAPAERDVSRRGLYVFVPLPDSLPGSRREAHAVQRLLPSAVVRVGAQSRETDVRTALTEGARVHIASHGRHNPQNPLFSRVVVGRQRGGASQDDGRLEVHEILGLRTTSALVFLSGCETGLGAAGATPFATDSDEGSLARAFLIAGARSVVATLWRVDDKAAEGIAVAFYRHLGSRLDADVALAFAQREAIRAGSGLTWSAYTVARGGRASFSALSVP